MGLGDVLNTERVSCAKRCEELVHEVGAFYLLLYQHYSLLSLKPSLRTCSADTGLCDTTVFVREKSSTVMISAADAFLVLGILAGIVLIAIGYRTYQMSERLGRRSFVALMLILGIGCVAAGLGWVIPSPVLPNEGGPIEWARVLFVIWSLSVVPWFVFATRYTGTQTQNQLQTLALAGIPVLVLVADALLFLLDFESDVLSILSAFVFLYTLFLAATGTYLIVKKSYKYGHIRLGQGVSLSVVPLAPVVFWNLIGTASSGPLGPAGAYAGGVLFAALGASIALTRYETFESTPSIGTLGERALIRETGDLMIVVDDSDRVVTINETATEILGVTREATVGTSLQQCLGHDSAGLRDAETVTVQTTRGSRKYDPQVSLVRDHCHNGIGATLSLRDVTERGLREQRLAVLNRVLRHNIRNKVDVLKSHAETLNVDDAEIDPVLEAADEITSLGDQARRIDQYISKSTDDTTVDLTEAVQSVIDMIREDDVAVDIAVETPPSATLTTEQSAVVGALRSALDNAVTYADSAVTVSIEPRPNGYGIYVIDDGAGIPDWEVESLNVGTESPLGHSTGLGLWELKWAVRALNGDLSFDTTDGTTVEIFVPDRSDEPMTV